MCMKKHINLGQCYLSWYTETQKILPLCVVAKLGFICSLIFMFLKVKTSKHWNGIYFQVFWKESCIKYREVVDTEIICVTLYFNVGVIHETYNTTRVLPLCYLESTFK